MECADWIEHTLATGRNGYLRTSEAEMDFVRRHNIDVVVSYMAGALVSVAVAWRLLARAAGSILRPGRRVVAFKAKES